MTIKSKLLSVFLVAMTAVAVLIYASCNKQQVINISGKWDIVFDIEESTYKPLMGSSTTNRIVFTQKGEHILAEGTMTQFNKMTLLKSEQIPLHLEGEIHGDTIRISYNQDGNIQKEVGEIIVAVALDGNSMTGTFRGKLAKSNGKISAKRVKE